MISKEFIHYLHERNLYSKFISDFHKESKRRKKADEMYPSRYHPKFEAVRQEIYWGGKTYGIPTYLYYGFIWDNSDEGDSFWRTIAVKTEDFYCRKHMDLEEFAC